MKDKEEHEEEYKEEITETLDFTKPDYIFTPKGHHEWRQQGPYCICKTCDIHHAIYIGVEKVLVGIDELGAPILKKRVDVGVKST